MRRAMAAVGLIVVMAVLAVIGDRTTTAATEHKRFVEITGNGCTHDVHGPDITLIKHNGDKLKWVLTNSCPVDTRVLVCIYRDGSKENPFEACADDGNVEGPVTVPKLHGHKKVTCKPKSAAAETRYQDQIFVGAEIPSGDQCPSQPVASARPARPEVRRAAAPRAKGHQLTHILDFDIAQ